MHCRVPTCGAKVQSASCSRSFSPRARSKACALPASPSCSRSSTGSPAARRCRLGGRPVLGANVHSCTWTGGAMLGGGQTGTADAPGSQSQSRLAPLAPLAATGRQVPCSNAVPASPPASWLTCSSALSSSTLICAQRCHSSVRGWDSWRMRSSRPCRSSSAVLPRMPPPDSTSSSSSCRALPPVPGALLSLLAAPRSGALAGRCPAVWRTAEPAGGCLIWAPLLLPAPQSPNCWCWGLAGGPAACCCDRH